MIVQGFVHRTFQSFVMLFDANPCLIYVLVKYAILAHSWYKYVVMVIPANSFVHDRFGTYCIGEKQMLRRACASTQSPCAAFTARAYMWHVIVHLADS